MDIIEYIDLSQPYNQNYRANMQNYRTAGQINIENLDLSLQLNNWMLIHKKDTFLALRNTEMILLILVSSYRKVFQVLKVII